MSLLIGLGVQDLYDHIECKGVGRMLRRDRIVKGEGIVVLLCVFFATGPNVCSASIVRPDNDLSDDSFMGMEYFAILTGQWLLAELTCPARYDL